MISSTLASLYGLGLRFRHQAYDKGWFASTEMDIPILSVGNLRVGGTGKTPMIAYWLDKWQHEFQLGVLSRGYKRRSRGFQLVSEESTVYDVGDELLQLHTAYPDVAMAAAIDRVTAIPELLASHELDCILLDDGFQHRQLRGAYHLLLTSESDPYFRDSLLPKGNLRDLPCRAQAANAVIITKSNGIRNRNDLQQWRRELRLEAQQLLGITELIYQKPYLLFGKKDSDGNAEDFLANWQSAHVLTGIAGTAVLENYVRRWIPKVQMHSFRDHHYFTAQELENILGKSVASGEGNLLLTTEKDASRLTLHREFLEAKGAEVYVLPVAHRFLYGEQEIEESIRTYCEKYQK